MKSIYLIGAMQIYGEKSEEAKEWRDKVKEYFSEYSLNFDCIAPFPWPWAVDGKKSAL